MNKGDYVRTKYGEICKIQKPKYHYLIYSTDIEIDRHNDRDCNDYGFDSDTIQDIIKSSPNIIDLIEEHDLLKIEYKISDESIQTEVVEVIRNYQGILYVNTFVGKFFVVDLERYNRKILSIVTHEQFSSMEYKVESEVK